MMEVILVTYGLNSSTPLEDTALDLVDKFIHLPPQQQKKLFLTIGLHSAILTLFPSAHPCSQK